MPATTSDAAAGAAYDRFENYVNDLYALWSTESLLDWDSETYMPKQGSQWRAKQVAIVAELAHQKLTSDELANMIGQLEREVGDDPIRGTNVRDMRREFDRAQKIPASLVKEMAGAIILAKSAWREARAENHFAKFAPHLEKLLEFKRRVADFVGWTTEPYDALMDEFEPGAKAAEVDAVFSAMRGDLVALVNAIRTAPRQPDEAVLHRNAPRAEQDAFNRTVSEKMGFDFRAGRLDVSAHPFCSGTCAQDVRMTTRFNEQHLAQSLFGVMHETGHGLYEQGFEESHTGTPMARAVSLGIHESQSRMWENVVGRSRPFWQHFFPLLQRAVPSMKDVSLDAWHFAVNMVKPSLIRVEADEVTYGLHIMLRFDLERRLISNQLAVSEVPQAWNDGMKSLLGVTPPNDAQGCLQDIHWSIATYGYFPTYQLGNLYAAQFFEAALRDMPNLWDQIAGGDLLPLREWLRDKIHKHGRRYLAGELVQVVTGKPLTSRPFLSYLKDKYEPLYGLR